MWPTTAPNSSTSDNEASKEDGILLSSRGRLVPLRHADIAYHRWKWSQCNELINVLGEDHKLQAQQVGLTLEELGERRPEVMFYSFIKLPEGKMSTRRGNVVFMDDLLEEAQAHAVEVLKERRPDLDEAAMTNIAEAVGTSAVRFNIISVSPEKGFTFRWEDALSFEAGSAPFIMYSHTRACSIQAKVQALLADATIKAGGHRRSRVKHHAGWLGPVAADVGGSR